MKTRCAMLILLLAGTATPALAKSDEWVELRSPHFRVVSNAKPKKTQELALQLEKFRQMLSEVSPSLRLDPPTAAVVVLFKNAKSFRPYRPSTPGGKPLELDGYSLTGSDGAYLVVNAGDPDAVKIIQHEFIHLVMRLDFKEAPVWLNEGMAQFLQGANFHRAEFRLGTWEPALWQLLQERDLIPISVLLGVDQQSDYYNLEPKRSSFYAQSWLLVHFLMAGDSGKRQPQLNNFIRLLRQGVPQETALARALGMDAAGIDRQLRGYLQQRSLSYFHGKFSRPFELKAGEAQPIPAAAAQAVLADLWLGTGRLADAEQALSQLAATTPDEPEVRLRLGKIALQRGQPQEAEGHFRAALAARPDDATLRYYASLAVSMGKLAAVSEASERHRLATEVVEWLSPVLAQPGDFPDAFRLLLEARLARDDPPAELIPLVERARQTGPRREDFGLLLAHLYLREERWDDAERVLLAIANEPESPNREQARAWLNRVREGRQGTMRWGTARGESSEPAPTRPAAEPVESPPAAAPGSPPEIRYVRGTLVTVACAGEGAVVTVEEESRKGAPGKTLHLAVRSLQRVILIDPTESGKKLDCGPSGVPVTINYRVEPQGPSVAGVVMTIELYPPER